MSLISDALKKARQEAARQDSLRQGVPYAVGPVDAPARRNPLLPMLAGLGAGCLVAGLLFVVAYVSGWGPFGKPVQEARVAEAAAPQPSDNPAVEPAPTPPPVVSETTPTPPQAAPQEPLPAALALDVPPQIEMRPSVEPPAALPEPQATPPATPATPAPVEEERPAPAPVPPAPVPQAPAAPVASNSGGLVDGKLYTEEIPVPGGGTVKLNGIAFSQDQPVALIDGRVMGPGEVIQGFTVVAIEPGRVTLKGHGATVYLAPK